MRVLCLALLISGCSFHIEGIVPPGGDTGSPGNPSAPSPPTGGTTPSSPAPTPPPASGTPQPPVASDLGMPATTTPPPVTDTPDLMPPEEVHVGAACNADPDCIEPGLKCFRSIGSGLSKLNLPGGYCSKPCDSKTPCPTGSECIATLYGAFCMNRCANSDGNKAVCRTGYACCDSVDACGLQSFCGN